jgi:hypothetical protein
MFFSVFWTAYIPVTLIVLSLVWQSLVDFFHRQHGRARIACDQAKVMSQRQPRDLRDARPMLVDNWR